MHPKSAEINVISADLLIHKLVDLRENVVQNVLGALAQSVGEEYLKVDDNVALFVRLLGVGQPVALQPFGGGRLEDLAGAVDADLVALQRGDLDHGAAERLAQRDLVRVLQVGAVSRKDRVRRVANNKSNVCRDFPRHLVALLREGDLRAGLPARLHIDLQHFVFRAGGTVFAVDLSRNLHFLLGASFDLFQRNEDLLLNGRVLGACLLAPVWWALVGAESASHATAATARQSSAMKTAQQIIDVHVHIILTRSSAAESAGRASAAEKRAERVGGAEKLGECRPWIAMVGVGEARAAGLAEIWHSSAAATGSGVGIDSGSAFQASSPSWS